MHASTIVILEIHHTLQDLLCLTQVIEGNLLTSEQLLVHIWMLELSAYRNPLPFARSSLMCTCAVYIPSDVDSVVYQTELLVRSLMLELVSILSPEVDHEIDDFLGCLRNLDRIRLDVRNSKSLFLHRI